jgi:hypothetical protein
VCGILVLSALISDADIEKVICVITYAIKEAASTLRGLERGVHVMLH